MPSFNLHIIISGKKLFSISVTVTFLYEELKAIPGPEHHTKRLCTHKYLL
jgi:hypothetical protein